MLQRNERGRQARRYFIRLEKDWSSPEKVMARALLMARQITGGHPETPPPPMLPSGSPARMRTITEAVKEMQEKDPESAIKVSTLRRWVKEGTVPAVKSGNTALVNMAVLEQYIGGSFK